MKRRHEFEHGLTELLLENVFAGREPVAVIVSCKIFQECEPFTREARECCFHIIGGMSLVQETFDRLAEIPGLTVLRNAPLSKYTRFGIGGPADIYAETGDAEPFVEALQLARSSGLDTVVIGGGTNLS